MPRKSLRTLCMEKCGVETTKRSRTKRKTPKTSKTRTSRKRRSSQKSRSKKSRKCIRSPKRSRKSNRSRKRSPKSKKVRKTSRRSRKTQKMIKSPVKTRVKPKAKKEIIQKPSTLKVMTYNIHNGFFDESDVINTFEQMTKWLVHNQMDVICFQEVSWRTITQSEFTTKMKKLGYTYILLAQASDLYGWFGQAICSRLPFEEKYVIDLDKGNQEEGRSAAMVTLENGITIVNTHLDVWDKSGKTRIAQIKQIRKIIEKKKLKGLLCGDFNCTREKDYTVEQLANIKKFPVEYKQDFQALKEISDYPDVFDIVNRKAGFTHLAAPIRIDYMFVFGSEEQIEVQSVTKYNVRYSDHYPLSAILDI